ncbi:MAG: ABC transporter substrate-binding protein [Patescibacteria group bacterium]|nr:ABC transporter substrate-binding protein [Patescibacteria group bacterium]
MRKSVIILLVCVLILAIGCWLAAVRLSDRKTDNLISPTVTMEPVKVGLVGSPSARFAGEYFASQGGLYAQRGLDVSFGSSTSQEILAKVISGEYQFGLLSADALIKAKAGGRPLTAVFVTYRVCPVAFFIRPGSGIATAADFVNRKIGVNDDERLPFRSAMRRAGVAAGAWQEVPRGDSFAPFLNGDYDVLVGWVSDAYRLGQADGSPYVTITAADLGVQNMTDVIVTTEDFLKRQPEIIRGFVVATQEGWQKSFEETNQAVQYVHHFQADATAEGTTTELQALHPFIQPNVGSVIGESSFVDWRRSVEALDELDHFRQGIDVASLYDMSFLP